MRFCRCGQVRRTALYMFAELRARLEGKRVLILGVGNRLRGDDAVGPLLVEHLQGKVDIPLIDAGEVPENYLGPIEESGADMNIIVYKWQWTLTRIRPMTCKRGILAAL